MAMIALVGVDRTVRIANLSFLAMLLISSQRKIGNYPQTKQPTNLRVISSA